MTRNQNAAQVASAVSRDDAWLRRSLAHEFTHAYMDRVWVCTGPLWFAEGMAEYFAGFTVRDGRAVPGAIDRKALLLLRLDGTVGFDRFLATGRDEMYGPTFAKLYAQSWALVHHLFAAQDGTIDLLLRGKPIESPDALEEAFNVYVGRLE